MGRLSSRHSSALAAENNRFSGKRALKLGKISS